jgi:hypothetical protein
MMGRRWGEEKIVDGWSVRSEVCFAAKNFSTSEETSSEGDGGKNLKRTQYKARQGKITQLWPKMQTIPPSYSCRPSAANGIYYLSPDVRLRETPFDGPAVDP